MKNENGIERSAILKGSTKYRDIDTEEFLETFEEGRNLELVSVKMPVLTTTDKSPTIIPFDVLENAEFKNVGGFTSIPLPYELVDVKCIIKIREDYPHNIKFQIGDIDFTDTGDTLIKGKEYVKYIPAMNDIKIYNWADITNGFGKEPFLNALKAGSVSITLLKDGCKLYPYYGNDAKTNILTVNEEVELRGIGEVRDELNVVNGELTQRIKEVVFDGSENWARSSDFSSLTNTVHFQIQSDTVGIEFGSPLISDKFINCGVWEKDIEGINCSTNGNLAISINRDKLSGLEVTDFKKWLSQNNVTVIGKTTESIKTVDLSIQDQDNQPQEHMKLFPNGHINTSSSTFPPILELKGVIHNNKLNMTTTNGTNNTQLTTLDNLVLDGIICRDGTVVRDSYDVESGLYTKRVFRFTIDEEFIERYRDRFISNGTSTTSFEMAINIVNNCNYPNASGIKGIASNIEWKPNGEINRIVLNNNMLYIHLLKEEVSLYDMDGLLDWIKRNGAIEVAYQMATPQIIHMQPNMQPYVSTRPYQGSIESQGNILESSFLDYTSEQSIISPKPLGDGDVLRWEQGSQCYVYENEKEYIPLEEYNQPMGTVLDLEEEDGEQFVENLDGGDIIVDVPFKEKAVYERHLVSHEDNVIYPTQDKLDPTGKIEVDYICGATWQNPDDLSDIRHVGTLREDGQYDVTIRRSGDDEIRLMDGITNISLDGDGLNPSEFELTFFNSGGVEVGKYGDTTHTLEDCVLDSKLETGAVYGETLVNLIDTTLFYNASLSQINRDSDGWITISANGTYVLARHKYQNNLKTDTLYTLIVDVKANTCSGQLTFIDKFGGGEPESAFTINSYSIQSKATGRFIQTLTTKSDLSNIKCDFRIVLSQNAKNGESITYRYMLLEGDYTNYPMDIPFFEGVGSTIVNGFTTTGKNLFDMNRTDYTLVNSKSTIVIQGENEITVTDNEGTSTYVNISFKLDKNFFKGKTVTGSCLYVSDEKNVGMLQIKYKDNTGKIYYQSIKKPNTFTFPEEIMGDISLDIYTNNTNTPKANTMTVKNIQIEYGSQATEFKTYQPQIQYTLPTPITLNKVGDVADTYDVVSGVETNKIEVLTPKIVDNIFRQSDNYVGIVVGKDSKWFSTTDFSNGINTLGLPYVDVDLLPGVTQPINENYGEAIGQWKGQQFKIVISKSRMNLSEYTINSVNDWLKNNLVMYFVLDTTKYVIIQHTLIPSTIQTTQEPTFILPQPLRSVPNGICDRLYWDENKGHYCIEKRVGIEVFDGSETWYLAKTLTNTIRLMTTKITSKILKLNVNMVKEYATNYKCVSWIDYMYANKDVPYISYETSYQIAVSVLKTNLSTYNEKGFKAYLASNPITYYYPLATPQIIDLPHLNKKLTLPTQPDTLPIGYKVENTKANPQLGLTIPYKQLNYPSRPQNIDFKMDIADYVLTWDDVKEARQYNVILNDRVIATVKEPQWNSGEEMYGYIMVEAQNELAENLSEELYIKTVPNAPAQLTVAHNPMTNYYDFEISFIKTSAIAEYYTVQYRIDGGEWVYKTIQSDEIDPNSKVLWKFSVYEINEQIEVWATATNDIGTNDILPIATYYMSPTPQWTYRINSNELFVRWMDDSPYDTQYKLRYQYKSDGIYRYAYFEGDKQEIGKLYEALIPLADDEEVSIALCVISEKENLYTKPIKASKELDPNIKPPKNFNYHWLARGLIEFYWEDNYDVDVEYEAIVEHRLTSGSNEWITDTRIFSATDTEGTGTVYRLSYQLEDLEEIRVKVRMKWAMNETEWSESLTTVFIPVEGNPPQWIRRTQTQEGLLVEWEAQEYVDSYHVYVMSNGEELQHLETMDNFIYVDLDYSNPIDIEIYESTRFSGGIESDPTDKMCFRPTMDKHQLIHDVVTPDTLTYEIEVDTVQRAIKERQVIHDINTTPKVTSKQPMDVAIKSPFTLSFHPLQLDVHQAGSKHYGDTELHIKTLNVKSRDAIEVLTFERITDQYGVDFTVYTPSASKYPITLEVNRVRIVCFGDSLTSGHPGFWRSYKTAHLY